MKTAIAFTSMLLSLYVSPVRAEMSLSIETITVDQLTVKDLSCNLESRGAFVLLEVMANLSAQRTDLDACAPQGGAFQVQWRWNGEKASSASVSRGSPSGQEGCIQKALLKTRSSSVGTCSGTILTGPGDKAELVYSQLKIQK